MVLCVKYYVRHFLMKEDGTYSADENNVQIEEGTLDKVLTLEDLQPVATAYLLNKEGYSLDILKTGDINVRITADGNATVLLYYSRNKNNQFLHTLFYRYHSPKFH